MPENWEKYRNKIIGLGNQSNRKSYYPELQNKIDELEHSKQNLQSILDNTSDNIVIHSIEGKILFVNNQAAKTLNIEINSTLRL